MKFKVGDRLLCKKSTADETIFQLGVKEGEWYDVVDVSKLPKGLSAFTLGYIHVNDGKSVYNFSFSIYDYPKSLHVWDYFYTEKELRKTKLEQIDEKRDK